MKKQIRYLYELGELDKQVQEHLEVLENIPVLREELEEDINAKRLVLQEKRNQLETFEKNRRERERKVEEATARVDNLQSKLNQIKTNKEYQAANKEVADTKKINKMLEDEIIGFMSQIEALGKEIPELEEELQGKENVLEKQNADASEEEKKRRFEIKALEDKREVYLGMVDPKVMSIYNKARRMGQGVTAEVVGGICQGCSMKVAPQLHLQIQRLDGIFGCPSCHRILYVKEWFENEK